MTDLTDDLFESKPQHLLYECGDFRIELTANCTDWAFSSMVRGVMEPIMRPQTITFAPGEAETIRDSWVKGWRS